MYNLMPKLNRKLQGRSVAVDTLAALAARMGEVEEDTRRPDSVLVELALLKAPLLLLACRDGFLANKLDLSLSSLKS